MKIELVLKSPTVSIPVSFSASSPSGGDAHNGLPSGGSNGDILVKVGKEEYESEWKPVDDALGDFHKRVQDALDEQSKKTEESLKQKLDKTDAKRIVYANDVQGIPTPLGFNDEPTGYSVVQRTKDGQVKANPAVEDNDAVTLSQMNDSVGGKSSVTVDGKFVLEFPADTYIAEAIAALVNSAPATLDTLAEIAKALGNDPNFATTILAELGKKADKTTGLNHILGTDATGKDIFLTYAQGASSKTIPIRTPYGQIRAKAAVNDEDVVNLAQMNGAIDERIGDISTALDELHAYAQTIVNGGSVV